MKTIKEIENYWKNPDKKNLPIDYLKGEERTRFLIDKISPIANKNDSILEIGCNVGRNLNGLYMQGFNNLTGIEINKDAINEMYRNFPDMANHADIFSGPAESILKKMNYQFDIIYTMAVLCHIHPDVADTVFQHMARLSKKYIITIENEVMRGKRHFVRDYKKIFESLGMKQVESSPCTGIPRLEKYYIYRMFEK